MSSVIQKGKDIEENAFFFYPERGERQKAGEGNARASAEGNQHTANERRVSDESTPDDPK